MKIMYLLHDVLDRVYEFNSIRSTWVTKIIYCRWFDVPVLGSNVVTYFTNINEPINFLCLPAFVKFPWMC